MVGSDNCMQRVISVSDSQTARLGGQCNCIASAAQQSTLDRERKMMVSPLMATQHISKKGVVDCRLVRLKHRFGREGREHRRIRSNSICTGLGTAGPVSVAIMSPPSLASPAALWHGSKMINRTCDDLALRHEVLPIGAA